MDESTVEAAISSFEKQLGELEEIFTKIRDAVWVNTPPPDFSRVQKDEDVLVLFTVLRAVCRDRIIKIIDQPSVDWKVIYQRANSLCDTIHEPRNLAALFYYDLSVNGRRSSLKLLPPLRSLIKLDLNTAYTYGELLNRIKDRPIGSKAFRLLADEEKSEHEAFLEIVENLRLGPRRKKIAKITSYHPQKFSDEDLRQEAMLGAWGYWHKVKAAIGEEIQLPQSPIRLPAKRSELWEVLSPFFLQSEAKAWAGPLLPILRGEWEKLPYKAHQALKNLWDKEKAAKRDGIEWEKIVKKYHDDQVEKIILKDQVEKVIQTARTSVGPKAAEAFQHRVNVDTNKEAAKLAGIMERTYRNYVKKVREIYKDR